ncbi:hypothetical protein [Methylobacterium sp. 22177]|uniref:hypothetical protein n=1 Tax=Methylobacterium sp. 22177 TaxID=3453885 RepID=UPI003F82E308
MTHLSTLPTPTLSTLAIGPGSWRDAPLPQRGDVIDARGLLRLALSARGMRLSFCVDGMIARDLSTNESCGGIYPYGDFAGMHAALVAGEMEVDHV